MKFWKILNYILTFCLLFSLFDCSQIFAINKEFRSSQESNIYNVNVTAIAELTQQLSAYQSYQANFTQSTYNRGGQLVQQSQGAVKIYRPGRFRWEIMRPVKQLIIANGNTLWVYDVDLAQASKQTLGQQGLSPAVLLSSSVNDLAQKFTVHKLKNQEFELIPKQGKSNFPSIRLLFVDNKLTTLQMKNSLGQNNVFDFNNIIINQPLSAKWFEFTPSGRVNVLSR